MFPNLLQLEDVSLCHPNSPSKLMPRQTVPADNGTKVVDAPIGFDAIP